MRLHIVVDRHTGEATAQGRSGRRYSQEEIRRAEEGSRNGDAEARAIMDDLESGGQDEPLDPLQLLDDCPECRAAAAAGERPIVLGGAALEAAIAHALREGLPWRRRARGRR